MNKSTTITTNNKQQQNLIMDLLRGNPRVQNAYDFRRHKTRLSFLKTSGLVTELHNKNRIYPQCVYE